MAGPSTRKAGRNSGGAKTTDAYGKKSGGTTTASGSVYGKAPGQTAKSDPWIGPEALDPKRLARQPEEFDTNDWRTKVRTFFTGEINRWAKDQGYPGITKTSPFNDMWDDFLRDLEPYVLTKDVWQAQMDQGGQASDLTIEGQSASGLIDRLDPERFQADKPFMIGRANPHNDEGLLAILNVAARMIDLTYPGFGSWYASEYSGSPSGPGGGGGARKPTSAEIRSQFDMDELTNTAQKMARAYLVEDLPNARDVASAYVEAVVATGGEQDIDFGTYVQSALKKTARWKQVYRNAPPGVDPLEYMAPYAQAALSALGGNRGRGIGKVVGEGAALGGSPDAFRNRLLREDSVRNQSGYITKLEERMSGISNVLRG